MNEELAKQLAQALQQANEAAPGMAEALWAALVRGNMVEGIMAAAALAVCTTFTVLLARTFSRVTFGDLSETMDYEQIGTVQLVTIIGGLICVTVGVACFVSVAAAICPEYYATKDLLSALGR